MEDDSCSRCGHFKTRWVRKFQASLCMDCEDTIMSDFDNEGPEVPETFDPSKMNLQVEELT